MRQPRTFKFVLSALVALFLASCDTWESGINIDPNNPPSLQESETADYNPSQFMLDMIGNTINGWDYIHWNVGAAVCEYHGKTISLSQGNRHQAWHAFDDSDNGGPWVSGYNAVRYIKKMQNAAIAMNDKNYLAIANIWECYNFFNLTLLYGDIPYTETMLDNAPIDPVYDKQKDIYFTLMRKLKAAGLMIDKGETCDAETDLIFGGDMADGVYWLDLNTGNFVSSTFFTQRLPDWLVAFNSRKLAYQYIDQTWKLLLPADQYPFTLEDDNHYEEIMGGKTHPAFPYDLKEMASKNAPYFEVLNRSPWGNTLIADLAIEALKQEKLGKDNIPDLLQISFSSTDAVGHTYGPLSMEINDTYLRLDRDLARLLKALDNQVGKGNYVVFLVADHGLGEVPQYLEDHNIPAGDFKVEQLRASLTAYLDDKLGKGNWVECIRNEMVYLNQTLIRQRKLELTDVQNLVARFIKQMDGVAQVYTAVQLDEQEYTQKFSANVQNGFNYKRCGDVKYVFEPGWYSDLTTCATHSAQYNADSHVPLLFFGARIPKGESFNGHSITDLAPTVSMLLDIKMPNACTGTAIAELLNQIHR